MKTRATVSTALALVTACVNLPVIAAAPEPVAIIFPEDKPYLRTFYQDFMLPKARRAP